MAIIFQLRIGFSHNETPELSGKKKHPWRI